MFPVNTQLETIVVESLDGVPERYSATRGKKKYQKKPTALYIYFAQKVSQGLHWISPYVYRVSQYLLWVAMQLSVPILTFYDRRPTDLSRSAARDCHVIYDNNDIY